MKYNKIRKYEKNCLRDGIGHIVETVLLQYLNGEMDEFEWELASKLRSIEVNDYHQLVEDIIDEMCDSDILWNYITDISGYEHLINKYAREIGD